ncbi:hypothetical protein BH23ACT6_BH23ACT6_23640 [soil metagenome]
MVLATGGEVIIWTTANTTAGRATSGGRPEANTTKAAMLNSFLEVVNSIAVRSAGSVSSGLVDQPSS